MQPPRSASVLDSFKYAGAGLIEVVRTQRNFRIHLCFTVGASLLAVWLRLDVYRWMALVLTIGSVLTAEIVNTAAETLVDLTSPDYHPLAKRVKDLAAAGVLMRAIGAVVVGLLIFGGPLLAKLGWG